MQAPRTTASDLGNRKLYLFSFLLVILTYLADSTLDAFLEHEDVYEQLLAPPRLLLLAVVFAGFCYVITLALRNSSLKKSSQVQLAAMESSIDGIAIFVPHAGLVYSNNAHTRLFGYDREEELVGKDWTFFYTDDELQRIKDQVHPHLKRHGEWRGEILAKKRDGGSVGLEVSLTRLENGGIIRVARDITEKKKYQIELERRAQALTNTNRELETFSYTLSHDMRSYITRVSAAAQLLLEGDVQELSEDGYFLVNGIQKSAEDMEQLVESIQVLASISRSSLSLEEVDLSQTVREICAGLALSDPEREVDLVVEPGVVATCDRKLAKVALYNLIQNAWKYTGTASAPRIEFGSEIRDGRRLLYLRDNGVGFDMEQADRLFEPFLRLDNAREYPGTGVGLATVQRVIQLHNGEVWGVGKPGQEATFYFSFPDPPTPC